MNISSDKEGIFVAWCMRKRLKEEATRRKSWSHPSTNSEVDNIVVARELLPWL